LGGSVRSAETVFKWGRKTVELGQKELETGIVCIGRFSARGCPLKKIPETDAIFDNLRQANRISDSNPRSLRISIDCKAKVKVGNLSRGGESRCKEAPKADDHDMHWDGSMVPLGIHDVVDGDLSLFFGTSNETSDFIVDCVEMWWDKDDERYSHIEELVINLDNGPSQMSGRTQFIKRMVKDKYPDSSHLLPPPITANTIRLSTLLAY